jgi:RNA polymerase sigma-70 factor (ECF subfamily)
MAVQPDEHDNGDADTLGALIDDALPRIFGYILVRTSGDRTTAEDLTQETMLALARALEVGGPTIADPLAWLFGTARFKVIDHYRAREQAARHLLPPGDEIDEQPEPIDDFERVLERDELTAELARLPESQRMALLLHYADGLSIAEVATALEKSKHAVESLLARGRRTIRATRDDQETER